MKSSLAGMVLCVSLASAVQLRALPSSCGQQNASFKVTLQTSAPPMTPPDAGKARVVFLETEEADGLVLSGVEARLGVDGAWVGATKGDSYFVVDISPGPHHLCANWQADFAFDWQRTSVAPLNAEPGKVYFYRVKINHIRTQDLEYHSLDLAPVNEDEGAYLAGSLALATVKRTK